MGIIWSAALANDKQVADLQAKPEVIADFINECVETGFGIDLDKEWHAVHYLLTGSATPTDGSLSFVLGAWTEVGADNGYGPAWHAPNEAVTAFHLALGKLSDDQLRARYDAAAMVRDRVYIADALAQEGEDARAAIIQDIDRLRTFAAQGAKNGSHAFGMLS